MRARARVRGVLMACALYGLHPFRVAPLLMSLALEALLELSNNREAWLAALRTDDFGPDVLVRILRDVEEKIGLVASVIEADRQAVLAADDPARAVH